MTLESREDGAGRVIDVLLIEDDPGDELITREAFEHNKIKNTLYVAHDGEEGLDFLYRRGVFKDAPRPDLILLDLICRSTTADSCSRRSSPIRICATFLSSCSPRRRRRRTFCAATSCMPTPT